MNAMSKAMRDTIGGRPFGKMCRRSTWRSLRPFAFAVVTKSSVITSMRELRMTREMPASVPTLSVRAGKMRWVDTLAMWAQSHAHCWGNGGASGEPPGGSTGHHEKDPLREELPEKAAWRAIPHQKNGLPEKKRVRAVDAG